MKKNFLKTLGPGLLWAGAAIGASHLVQSTRAGANFGFELVWILIFANFFKYPFFEFGPRYAAATGKTLIDGYKNLGKGAVIVYAVITISTMFIILAAVTTVTAGLFANIFELKANMFVLSTGTIIILSGIIAINKYTIIDKTVKFIIILLAISTVIAVIAALSKGYNPNPQAVKHFNWSEGANIAFLLALAGWMPTAIDAAIWHSVWSVAKQKETKYRPSVKEALFDFKIGYFGTAVLSIGFLTLGAIVMYSEGREFPNDSIGFSKELINLFTSSLGSGAYYVIAIAALATMLSTTLTCLDAFPRVLEPTTKILVKKLDIEKNTNKLRWFWLIISSSGAIVIFAFLTKNMKSMIDFATIISFLVAPILGYMNLKVILSKDVPKESKPGKFLIVLSYTGLIVLSAFCVYYIYYLLSA